MSEYEQQRMDRIRANQQKLVDLGLAPSARRGGGGGSKKRKRQTRRPKPRQSPVRRSTRQRSTVRASLAEESGSDQDDESDSEGYVPPGGASGSDESSGDDDAEWAALPLPVRAPSRGKKAQGKGGSAASKGALEALLTCEAAKTGRSSCRSCMEKIAKGDVRIGMQGWIAGRKAVTWQKPSCFASKISISVEPSGRSMCKATKVRFNKGEVRVGFTSHNTTSNVKVSALGSVLSTLLRKGKEVVAATKAPPIDWGTLLKPSKWDGWDSLAVGGADQAAITRQVEESRSAAEGGGPVAKKGGSNGAGAVKAEAAEDGRGGSKKNKTKDAREQPAVGKKTRTKGRVAWKWGSHVCYGTLLAPRETGSHCFARTHKGNVKTLAKGKGYWWMVDDDE